MMVTLVVPHITWFQMFKIYLSKVCILIQHFSAVTPDVMDCFFGYIVKYFHIVLFPVPPAKAVLSEDMSCSCPRCTGDPHYHWYKKNGGSWVLFSDSGSPKESGTFACRAVWKKMRSSMSNAMTCEFLLTDLSLLLLSHIKLRN